jgi:RNase H-fold protein (predicted Holliday junction resolvase)
MLSPRFSWIAVVHDCGCRPGGCYQPADAHRGAGRRRRTSRGRDLDELGLTTRGWGSCDGRAASRISRRSRGCWRLRAGTAVVGAAPQHGRQRGPAGREGTRFGRGSTQHTSLPIDFWDERLTTVERRSVMRETGRARRKRRARWTGAAAGILRSYLAGADDPPARPRLVVALARRGRRRRVGYSSSTRGPARRRRRSSRSSPGSASPTSRRAVARLLRQPLLLVAWARSRGRTDRSARGLSRSVGALSPPRLLERLTRAPRRPSLTIPEGAPRADGRALSRARFRREESFYCLLDDPAVPCGPRICRPKARKLPCFRTLRLPARDDGRSASAHDGRAVPGDVQAGDGREGGEARP